MLYEVITVVDPPDSGPRAGTQERADLEMRELDARAPALLDRTSPHVFRDRLKIIGKQGRTAQAVRTILSAASAKMKKRTVLEIIE